MMPKKAFRSAITGFDLPTHVATSSKDHPNLSKKSSSTLCECFKLQIPHLYATHQVKVALHLRREAG
jgi:hypothetical protein